jgi:hypothetical protein
VICVVLANVFSSYNFVRVLSIIHFNKVRPHIILIHLYDMRSLVTCNNDLILNISDS